MRELKTPLMMKFRPGDQMVASRVSDFPGGLPMTKGKCDDCGAEVWQSKVAQEIATVGHLMTQCTQCAWGDD